MRQLVSDLNALPDRQRGALLLREASGYSYRRIASALGTSTGNARQTVHQAPRNLQKRGVGREHGWLGWALPGLAGAWLLRVLGLEELAANSLNAGKAALLAGALVVGGGAASEVAGDGALLGAATPSALASEPPPQALAALPRRLGQGPRHQPAALKRTPQPSGDRGRAVESVATAEPEQPRPARHSPSPQRDGSGSASRERFPSAERRATLGDVSFPGTAKPVRFEPAIWPPRPAPAPAPAPTPKPDPVPAHDR